jgi:hypothetical protein
MRFSGIAWIAAAAVCFQASSAQAFAEKEPLRLKPSSKWVANFGETGCYLIREFGEGENKSTLMMSRYSPTESFGMTLGGKLFRQNGERDVMLQFGPTEAEQKAMFLAGSRADKAPAMVLSSDIRFALPSEAERAAFAASNNMDYSVFSKIGPDRQKKITFLKIGKPLRQQVIFETGPMDKPIAVMDKCIDSLMATWGIDVEKHKKLTRAVAPKSNPGNWVKSSEYPLDMLSEGQPAIVEFRLDISEIGEATACHIQATTRPKEFDNAVCRALMRRAEFTPALDAEDKPLKSYWKSTVRFALPSY